MPMYTVNYLLKRTFRLEKNVQVRVNSRSNIYCEHFYQRPFLLNEKQHSHNSDHSEDECKIDVNILVISRMNCYDGLLSGLSTYLATDNTPLCY